MSVRRARLVVVAVLVGAIGGVSVGAGEARACSCQIPELVADLERAEVIVSGSTVDFREEPVDEPRIVRRWLFEVDGRYRGDTADVIEIVLDTELSSCADTRVSLPQVLLLERRRDGTYLLPECISTPHESQLAPFFEAPWPADAEGPPVAIVPAPTGTHDLMLLNEAGGIVAYLPGEGRTIGLSNCPDDRYFVQLRTPTVRSRSDLPQPTGAELVRWRYADLEPEEVIPLDRSITDYFHDGSGIPLNCRGAEGSDVGIDASAMLEGRSSAGVEYVGGTFAASEDVFDHVAVYGSVVVLGPGDLALVPAEGVIRAPLVDGDNPSAPDISVVLPHGVPEFTGWENYQSVRPTPSGWEVTLRQYGDDVDTFFVVDVTVDGDATLSDRASGSPIERGPAIVVEPSLRNGLPRLDGPPPGPLFDREGRRIDTPPPTLVPDPATTPRTTSAPNIPAVRGATVVDRASDAVEDDGDHNDDTLSRWVAGGILMLVVIAGVVLVVRRSAGRRGESPVRGREP